MAEENPDLFWVKLFSGFIVTVICVFILKQLKTVFVPLFLALLLYFLFNGVINRLLNNRFLARILPLGLHRILVLCFLLIFLFIAFYLFGVLLYAMASSFIKEFPVYSERIGRMIEGLFEQLQIPISDVNQYITTVDWSKSINTVTRFISTTFGSFATFLGNLVLIIIFLMFMLAGRDSLERRIRNAFVAEKSGKILYVLSSIEDRVQHYLLIKTFVSVLTALISGVVLAAANYDFVLFSAMLIFFLNYIPNFGSVVATTFPILIGFIKFGFSLKVLLVSLALVLIQTIIGNVVEPAITGRNLNLSPIIILIALIFWGWIWGITGMILAVPLMSALKILMEHIKPLRPLAELISAG